MSKYSDEDIRNLAKVTCKIAGEYLGVSSKAITLGLQQEKLPIGYATLKEDRYSESWSYHIVAERLIAYKYGRINAVQVESIERNLTQIVHLLEKTKTDLMFLLNEQKKETHHE